MSVALIQTYVSNYTDFVDAMAQAKRDGLSPEFLILTEDSMSTFLTDGKFTDETEEMQKELGMFEIDIERGDTDALVTTDDTTIPL